MIELDESPRSEDFRTLVDGVRLFNRDQTGYEWPRPVAFYIREAERRIIAGVQGTLWGRSMHIDALWVNDPHRRSGYGSRLMKAIEDYAAAHAHPLVYLETTSFQALPFYEGLGYRVFGELPRISDGHTLYFLMKELNSAD
ncbi:MAG TPA: GNAT family N-acetyltransferase [Pyrinomonadaceae bacterium]|nr:GNAT family N-acetyltransferase [Pyrinomonadaceae bacterium]